MASADPFEEEERFEDFTDESIEEMRQQLRPKNTVKSNDKCEKIFLSYLKSKKLNTHYADYTVQELDKILGKFWFEVRQTNKKHYRVQSMHHIRYGINRLLKAKGKEYDITTDPRFIKSQDLFEDSCRRLKKLGYGHVVHYPEITSKGKFTYINSQHLLNTRRSSMPILFIVTNQTRS